MKQFAIAIATDDELRLEIISAPDWREATLEHKWAPWDGLEESEEENEEDEEEIIFTAIPHSIDEAKAEAHDLGYLFDCIEIPSP
jgi:hypothetical protein